MFDASETFARRARRRRHRNDDPALSGSRARAGHPQRRLSHPLAGEISGSEEALILRASARTAPGGQLWEEQTMGFLDKWQPQILAALRVVTGLLFLEHGSAKLLH